VISRYGTQHIINFVNELRDYETQGKFQPSRQFNFYKTSPGFYILGQDIPASKKLKDSKGIKLLTSENTPLKSPAGEAGELSDNHKSRNQAAYRTEGYFTARGKTLYSPRTTTK
jgi:hypothetical protein